MYWAFLSIGISLRTSSTLQSTIVWRISLVNANGERKVPPSVFYCPYYPLQCDRLMKHRISEDLFVTLIAPTVLRCHINNYQCNWSVIGQLYHHTQFGVFTVYNKEDILMCNNFYKFLHLGMSVLKGQMYLRGWPILFDCLPTVEKSRDFCEKFLSRPEECYWKQ